MKVPPVFLICATIMFTVTIAAIVVLSVAHADTSEFRDVLTTTLSVVGSVSGFGSLLYSGSAARGTAEIRDRLDTASDDAARTPGGSAG